MNLDQIATKCFILALFIRDDGERLLLGDGYYDFNQKLQHFQSNTIANDVVEIQGDNGQLLAGQVMRSGTQKFEGYIGDATTNRQTIEQKRSDFMAFFRIKHFYKVIYILPDGTAIQRRRGYLTDAPAVPEIFQKFPEYHIALNFEDVNYYEYAEDEHGDEIYAHIIELALSENATGGLVWDAIGAVSNATTWSGIQTAQGEYINITNELNIPAKLASVEMLGNAEQTTLPSGYTAVEYIEASATQYIDTGVQLGANDFSIEMGVVPTADASYEQPFLSIWTSAYGYWNWFKTGQNLDVYTSAHNYISGGATTGTYYDLKLSRNGSTWEQASNSATISWTYSPTAVNNTTIKVFNRGDLNGKANAQLYYLRISVAGELVRNYIPCYRESDNAVGLYDTVYGTFSPSATANSFTAGAESTSPSPTCPQPISTVTGEQTVKIEGSDGSQEFEVNLGSIELCKIGNYQDRIYKTDGKWYIEKQVGKVVLDGSETWGVSGVNSKVRYTALSGVVKIATNNTPFSDVISDYFHLTDIQSYNSLFNDGSDGSMAVNMNQQIGIRLDSAESVSDWTTWLASHPTTVYYALATPVDEEITNSTLIGQLEALGASSLYLGVNNIGTETQNAMPTLKIEYYTEYTLEGAGYEWEPGGNTAKTIVTVAGVDSAWPIWTVQGGAQNPTLTNITTGQTISWQGFVPEGQTLTINMAEMTADLAGANVFEYITGEWIRLAPGNNTLVYTAGNADKPSTLSWNGVLA